MKQIIGIYEDELELKLYDFSYKVITSILYAVFKEEESIDTYLKN